ncbi:MAG: hypothetical protein PHU85_14355 [Phycisphaerae bacterium]|nr:hypothetical protein [Phycisphaerae bacterium]
MNIDYYVIKDVQLNSNARSVEELSADASIRMDQLRLRHCMVSLCAGDGKLYCGCTNTAGDILHELNPATGKFRSLNFAKVAEPCDMKIHRGLWLDRKRNSLVFGIATLATINKTAVSPGARVMRYDLGTDTCHELIRPWQGNFIQATCYDAERQMVYSYTEPTKGFAVSDLAAKVNRRQLCVESIVHIGVIDPAGWAWGTWGFRGQHPFFRYHPQGDRVEFFENLVMPTSAQACNLMYPGAGPVDCMLTGPDGMVYVASAMGELYRLDPVACTLEYLGRPVPHNRLPGLVFAPDGLLYGVGGNDWAVLLWSYNAKTGKFSVLGEVAAADGRRCFRPHDLAYMDGRLYVGETDNPKVSGAVWGVTV